MTGRKQLRLAALVLFAAGLFTALWPFAEGRRITENIQKELSSCRVLLEAEEEKPELPEETEPRFSGLLLAARDYNRMLRETGQSGLRDLKALEEPAFCPEDFGLPGEAFGVLTIPAMDLELPLYLGAGPDHLEKGAALLSQTSIPIGGPHTNAVIAGHRGWKNAPFFKDILKLQKGDPVILRNPWETLTYEAEEFLVIEPDDTEAIRIREGEDLVTLLTCHPYGTGGRQRYLVICRRAEEGRADP